MQQPKKFSALLKEKGFTLIELMVGMVIGLLTSIIVMQVFSVYESQKKTTTGAADAQTDGNIALYTISHDLALAGFGLAPTGQAGTPDTALECPTVIDATSAVAVSGVLSPVSIVDGGSGNGGDSIAIRYGNSSSGGIPVTINGIVTTPPKVPVQSNIGCQPNDIALVMNWDAAVADHCVLTKISSAVMVPKTLNFYDSQAITRGTAAQNAQVACLGRWLTTIYTVDPDKAELLKDGTPIVEGIVNMQVQYGIAAAGLGNADPNYNQITQWVDATAANGWLTPTIADRNRIKAVRVTIVARSSTFAPEEVSLPCNANTDICAWSAVQSASSPSPIIKMGPIDPNWKHYRYKTYETIIPLRNVIWSKDTL